MNRIRQTILNKGGNILNVYFTAGFPNLNSTSKIIKLLDSAGVDIIELGMPYSDPLADGVTIQKSSEQALKNGLTLDLLFNQIRESRKHTSIPIVMMGYFNQLLQYGVEKFLETASKCGVDGMIIPDLPMDIYEREYKHLFEKYDLGISFLITPMTNSQRIGQADRLSTAFIYEVSSSSITGKSGNISDDQIKYFQRIQNMNLKSPRLIGFGIHDQSTFAQACKYSQGGIIGSAYIRILMESKEIEKDTLQFVEGLK